MKLKNIQQLTKLRITRSSSLLIVVLLFAAVGTFVLVRSHAQVPFVSVSASSGTAIGGAVSSQCTGYSGTCEVFSGQAASTGIIPPQKPSESLTPSPAFINSCDSINSTTCYTAIEAAITNARSLEESMSGLSMPGGAAINLVNFENLKQPEQIFILSNLERIDRGLYPVSGMTASLNSYAQTGANNQADPSFPSGGTLPGPSGTTIPVNGWGSIEASGNGLVNPMGADYGWMYNDGYGGFNADCTTPTSSGCWGHRDIILCNQGSASYCGSKSDQIYMGAADDQTIPSWTALFVNDSTNATPSDVVCSWSQALGDLSSGTTTCSSALSDVQTTANGSSSQAVELPPSTVIK